MIRESNPCALRLILSNPEGNLPHTKSEMTRLYDSDPNSAAAEDSDAEWARRFSQGQPISRNSGEANKGTVDLWFPSI
jgi:hypothetical protein